jgi:hypothetical protein
MKSKNATRYFSQFQVTIIVQIVFSLKLYLFKVHVNVLFSCFNKMVKIIFKLMHFYFENLLSILINLLVIFIFFTVQNQSFY